VDEGRLKARGRPLAALKKVRAQGVDRASSALAGAARAARDAAQARLAAEDATLAHARGVAARVEADRAALEAGDLRAGDLVDALAWGKRVAEEHDALAARAAKARETQARAQGGELQARADLSARKVDVDVVDRSISRREAEAQKAAEAVAEQEALESWRRRG
jgi:hypothetical protein